MFPRPILLGLPKRAGSVLSERPLPEDRPNRLQFGWPGAMRDAERFIVSVRRIASHELAGQLSVCEQSAPNDNPGLEWRRG
jgi:hypothetical protein